MLFFLKPFAAVTFYCSKEYREKHYCSHKENVNEIDEKEIEILTSSNGIWYTNKVYLHHKSSIQATTSTDLCVQCVFFIELLRKFGKWWIVIISRFLSHLLFGWQATRQAGPKCFQYLFDFTFNHICLNMELQNKHWVIFYRFHFSLY